MNKAVRAVALAAGLTVVAAASLSAQAAGVGDRAENLVPGPAQQESRRVAVHAWSAAAALADEPLNIVTVAGTTTLGDKKDDRQLLSQSGSGLAFDKAGNLYIAELGGQRILRVDPAGNVTTVAGTGVGGYNGDGRAIETQI